MFLAKIVTITKQVGKSILPNRVMQFVLAFLFPGVYLAHNSGSRVHVSDVAISVLKLERLPVVEHVAVNFCHKPDTGRARFVDSLHKTVQKGVFKALR